jgi:hypothetical protein
LTIADKAIDQNADAYFNILKILGRGGFGEVHHVRSKLSLEEYAVCNVASEWPQFCEFAADNVEKTSAPEESIFERQRSHQDIRERTHQSETALTSSSCQICGVR